MVHALITAEKYASLTRAMHFIAEPSISRPSVLIQKKKWSSNTILTNYTSFIIISLSFSDSKEGGKYSVSSSKPGTLESLDCRNPAARLIRCVCLSYNVARLRYIYMRILT